MSELTKEQAVRLAESGWWKARDPKEAARIQLWTDRLIMPFDEFQRCVELLLGRLVWTHEFADAERLRKEARLGAWGARAPTFEEIVGQFPSDKPVALVMSE